MPHALIVDDDASTRDALAEIAAAEGFTTSVGGSLRDARIQIARLRPDVAIVDLKLPDGDGMELFDDREPGGPFAIIVMTGFASVDTAVEAMRRGAADYLVKPVDMARVKAVFARIPRSGELRAEIGTLRGQLRQLGRFGSMLGGSPAMQAVYDRINRVATTEASVLLIGESGTGKELAASTIHQLSRRRNGPFLAVNCGAIAPNLIESELFGHEKGSFTGADRQHRGYFERAHGGTLFLDEIGEMPMDLQVKLLRVLETGAFMRVGTQAELRADVRLVSATNRDPARAVAEGRLRGDLYHRLAVFPLALPPLRQRAGDVVMLATHFLDELNAQHGTRKTLSPGALERLQTYSWPGNVRELKNAIERAYIMGDSLLDVSVAGAPAAMAASPAALPVATNSITVPLGTSLDDADKALILATLEYCGGVRKRAADLLGISLKTLYNRLVAYRGRSGHGNGNGQHGTLQRGPREGHPAAAEPRAR
jgi:two-component system, NtrC family, response regulator AtoC